MADSPLNNSWPSFSKLWMKRWSFKRGSECKPRVQSRASPGGTIKPCAQSRTGSASSVSPECVAEEVFFGTSPEDQDRCSVVSDYDCLSEEEGYSVDHLSSSLTDSQYYKDLEEVDLLIPTSTTTIVSDQETPLGTPPNCPSPVFNYSLSDSSSHIIPSNQCSPVLNHTLGQGISLSIDLNGLLGVMESTNTDKKASSQLQSMEFEDTDLDSFPILVRSMSTSRRHSWGIPMSPINLGRRLSLGTQAVDSDGDRNEDEEDPLNSSFVSSEEPPHEGDETDGPIFKFFHSRTKPAGRPLNCSVETLAADECSRAAHISRVVQTSKQAARAAGEELDPEENLQTTEGQSHIAKQRNSRSDCNVSGNVTWYEFLSNENDEEEEERSEKVERGTSVKRKLSSLRSRVTGSFNKDKGKNRETQKDKGKEIKDKHRSNSIISSNGHRFVPGAFSSCASCSLCSKALQTKHGLQCMNCAVNVHKSCKTLLTECTSNKNKRDSSPRPSTSVSSHLAIKDRDRERESASSQAPDGHSTCSSVPGMTVFPRGANSQPAAAHSFTSAAALAAHMSITSHSLHHNSSSGSLFGEMDETDTLRSKRCNEDVISLAPSTVESIIVEDAHYTAVRADLEFDAQDLEAESWSLAVDQQFVKKHSKETVKRQDVIYELMQTEMHHVRTLKIMLRVYVRELKENLQMDSGRLDCIFPRLESLLELHTHFLSRLKERRRENLESPSDKNYIINKVSDILITQFSGEIGEKMKDSYGDFCSHHPEAVSYYKEQLQNNKKFHSTIRKISNLSIVRRLGVPECILLVTQRITKYPVLVERILHNTEAGTQDYEDLTHALNLIKDTIVQVDTLINLHEKSSRLRDIYNKMEPKSQGKIKDGRVFRREDLAQGRRRLLHEGTVNWKAASGRLKDILAVLLSDVLILLQEKDQRYIFATVDNKPSVISLQKLIVREVAHEEKAMFLICASSNEPEMYEIHTSSKEERNTWMTHIRQAVESCPQTEERLVSEEEEARASRLKEFQERLNQKDAVIVQALGEKLQLFADMAEVGAEDTGPRSRLLLRGDGTDLQQGEALLKGAITEVENLQNLLQSGVREEPQRLDEGSGSGALPRRAGTFGGYDSSQTILNNNVTVKKSLTGESKNRDRSQRASSDPQLKDLCVPNTLEETVDESCCSPPRWNRIWCTSFPEAEFFDRVLMLSQRLYSLQAIIAQQDSQIELQRASLTERTTLSCRYRGNGLLENEKQRIIIQQREELANFQKLQSQHRQEQQRWEKEREKHRQQVEATETRLRQREDDCKLLEERLSEEREELERQREKYQHDLERLRESTRAVEKEKERLEHQRKIKRKTIEVAPMSGSLNGELCLTSPTGLSDLPKKSLERTSFSMAPADYPERPEVTVKSLKTEVPLHLLSTTNQTTTKNRSVLQQIPTKLAAQSSVKGKTGKSGKASHRSDSTASVDMKQMLPLKLSGRDDSALKAKRSISPHQPLQQHSDPLSPPDSAGPESQSPSSFLFSPTMTNQKPPIYPSQSQSPLSLQHQVLSTHHSQSSGTFHFPLQQQTTLGTSPQTQVLMGVPSPYQMTTEDSKEDVIFF